MTPAAKDKEDIRILLFFLNIKIKILPIIVERPARVVIRKAKTVLFIESPIKYMRKAIKKVFDFLSNTSCYLI